MAYGVISDLHLHEWASFSSVDAEGRNTRLMQTLHEVDRCCQIVLATGGDTVVVAGDCFHTRGAVKPMVFNPTADCFRSWSNQGVKFLGIPGNHDLASRDSRKLTSAVEMLANAAGMTFYHEPTVHQGFAFVPWFDKQADLLVAIDKITSRASLQLVIHAGIDGVLSGMPAHGLTAEKLAAFGFRGIYAGHYHHHIDMGHGVYSIGALSHQTWSDVGTRAGFLIVSDEGVKWHASHAPRFLDITSETDADELPFIVDGHYVRAKIGRATAAEVANWRESLVEMGAKGVLIQSSPVAAPVRVGSVAGKLASLPDVILAYCAEKALPSQVVSTAAAILSECVA